MSDSRASTAVLLLVAVMAMILAGCAVVTSTGTSLSTGTATRPLVVNPQTDPATAIAPAAAPRRDDPRPNVVLMLVDDMRADDLAYMPFTKRLLAERGVSYSNAISVNPLCCPARASLITGQYSHNNGVLSNGGFFGGMGALDDPGDTLPVWLQRAGYSTAYFGKYLNGYGDARTNAIPPGWDWWDATGNGIYSYTRFQFANNGDPVRFGDDYVTTRLRQRSDEVIRSFADTREETGEPFFVFDSYVAPHSSMDPAPWAGRMFGDSPIPEPQHRASHPDAIAPSLNSPAFNVPTRNGVDTGRVGRVRERSEAGIQRTFLLRIQALASVDEAVAQTVRTLKDTGQYDDTVLMFTSDNGFLLGEHGRWGKVLPQAASIEVPLLIAGPGFTGGQDSRRWATTPDIAATVADLAEATPGRTMDGVSLAGSGRRDPEPTSGLLIESGNDVATSSDSEPFHYQGLLIGSRYTYVRWRTGGREEELYDNRLDPHQMVNRAKDPRYGELVRTARRQLDAVGDCAGVGACETRRTTWPEPDVDPASAGPPTSYLREHPTGSLPPGVDSLH